MNENPLRASFHGGPDHHNHHHSGGGDKWEWIVPLGFITIVAAIGFGKMFIENWMIDTGLLPDPNDCICPE